MGVLHFPNAFYKNLKKVSRLVVLPDYQGIGIGTKFLDIVGNDYLENGHKFTITTSNPALINSLKKKKAWKLYSFGKTGKHKGVANMELTGAFGNRLVASFEKCEKQ